VTNSRLSEGATIRDLPRIHLAYLPTPMDFLSRLSGALGGPRIFIKRDDLTGLAEGGNKTRKLEYLLAEAKAQDADTLVTLGARQSNHCRQTAAAAARCGLRCILVLRGDPPDGNTGNLLLDRLLGAEVLWCGNRPRETVMDEAVAREQASGRRPYAIPLGGSSSLGAVAYAIAMSELRDQMGPLENPHVAKFDRIIFASSSGGTHGGLVAGAFLTGFEGEILGISIDQELAELKEAVSRIATGAADLLARPRAFAAREISASADYRGAGYGVMGKPEREAISLFARLEGVLLDPVYTARAAAGMIDLVRRRVIGPDETILFWHTGGTPALWAYERELLA
jgi:D-cysteine desulfhydrase family pyridoxal phosphate-dependent enzyme